MTTMSTNEAVALDGIPLDVADPKQYLQVLASIVQHHHVEILSQVAELDAWCRTRPVSDSPVDRHAAMAVIGWCGNLVAELIDREWSASTHNEFDVLAGYLAAHGLIGTAKSVLVYGAGTCRVGDYLNSLHPHRTVICTDLSWLMLYYGRALNEHALDRLPPASRSDRTYYRPRTDGCPRLETRSRPNAFKPPLCGDPTRIRYRVGNAFARYTGPACEFLVLPYVLDSQRGPAMRTMLIRIVQQLEIGQEMLVIMSCNQSIRPSSTRDPKVVLDTLRGSGFRITYVDITHLPYSFSMYGYGQVQTRPTTLVLRATRVADTDAAKILLSATTHGKSPVAAPTPAGQHSSENVAVSDTERLVLDVCETPVSYAHAWQRCAGTMDATAFDAAIGNLTSRHLAELDIVV